MLNAVKGFRGVSRYKGDYLTPINFGRNVSRSVKHGRLRGVGRAKTMLLGTNDVAARKITHKLVTHDALG